MKALRDPSIRLGVLAIALWALSAGVAVVAAFLGWGVVTAVALGVSVLADAAMYAGDPRLPVWLGQRRLAAVHRALMREATAVLAWVVIDTPTAATVTAVAVALLAVHAGHAGYRVIVWSHRSRRGGRIGWVGIDVDGVPEGPEVLPPILPQLWTVRGPRTALHTDLFVIVALAVAWLGGPLPVVLVGAALTVLAALAVLTAGLRRSRLIAALPSSAQANTDLHDALRRLAPEVVVYFSGGVGTTYQLNVWLETLERITRPTLLVIRERHHLEELLPTSLPIVIAPRAQDVEHVQTDSMQVVLYPTTVIRNNHMIRLPGLRHVFINHGDGDKAVTSSPLHRVFDEIWVAGQAACDRYLQRREGVRSDQLVVVGRPQLAHITVRDEHRRDEHDREGDPAGAPDPQRLPTVLYAPTWEGNFDNVDYSSVAPMGVALVDALLADGGIRVLFKSHPATGTRRADAKAALATIEERLRASGRGEIVGSEPGALYAAFNDCDVLLADVSSVVADFLASRKPYLMTNTRNAPHEELMSELPSTSGATIIDASDPGAVAAAVHEAVGPDARRARREALATYFLGPPGGDPIGRFVEEVDRCFERAHARHDVAERVDGSGVQR